MHLLFLSIVASTSLAACSFDTRGAAGSTQLGDGLEDAAIGRAVDSAVDAQAADFGGADSFDAGLGDDDIALDVVARSDEGLDVDVPEADATSADVADVVVDEGTEMDASDAPEATTVVCTEVGAQMFGGHCYFVLPPSGWGDAKDACASATPAAHLVVITSGDEDTFVVGLASVDSWIGLSAPATTTTASSFVWVDGEPVSFTDWAFGEPNGTGPCVALSTGSPPIPGGPIDWHDRACTELDAPICERE